MRTLQPVSVNFEFELGDIDSVELLGIFIAWLELYGDALNTKPEWITPDLAKTWDYVVINEMYEFIIRSLYVGGWLTYPESYFRMFQHVAKDRFAPPESPIIPYTNEEVMQVLHLDILLRHLLPSISDKGVIVREIIMSNKPRDLTDKDPIDYMLGLAMEFSKLTAHMDDND